MRRFFRNIPWKNVLIIALVAILGIGAIVAVTSIAKNDTKTISATEFKRGAIDSNGFYVESDTSIYTKDLIECQGLEIAPDFEATGSYQVFYYDTNKIFLGKTALLNCQSDGVYTRGENFAFAKYCRIMITPDVPKDDYGNTIEDYKIKFYEVAGIANMFTITVKKDQNSNFKDVYVADEDMIGKYYSLGYSNVQESPNYVCSKIIDLDNVSNVTVVVRNHTSSNAIAQLLFADESGTFIETVSFDNDTICIEDGITYVTVSVPENADSMVLNGNVKCSYCIYVK